MSDPKERLSTAIRHKNRQEELMNEHKNVREAKEAKECCDDPDCKKKRKLHYGVYVSDQ